MGRGQRGPGKDSMRMCQQIINIRSPCIEIPVPVPQNFSMSPNQYVEGWLSDDTDHTVDKRDKLMAAAVLLST